MTQRFKLLAVLAHPDDESLGFGGTLAKYSAEGVETHLVTATRGERGRFGSQDKTAEPSEVGRVREAELRAAAVVLGLAPRDDLTGAVTIPVSPQLPRPPTGNRGASSSRHGFRNFAGNKNISRTCRIQGRSATVMVNQS